MVYVASTTLSWRQWWAALTSPFDLASIRRQSCSTVVAGLEANSHSHNSEAQAEEPGMEPSMEAELGAMQRKVKDPNEALA
jgi:hypothetical protein